ncbi:MAG: DinB family protein [Chryseotalea sp.]|jgi:uncharacterized damage-inducible protein DinB|nr:DinB family protein [Flammeovirgaceae bacterium]
MEKAKYFQQLRDTVTVTKSMAKEHLAQLNENQINERGSTTVWSVGHCIEHINLYNRYYIQAIEKAILLADKDVPAIVKHTWLGRKSIQSIHPSNQKKQKTFKRMDPVLQPDTYTHAVLDQFFRTQENLVELINRAEVCNFNKKLVPIEFFKMLKLNIAETLEFILAHQQRHIHQAVKIAQTINQKESYLKV